jgi:hypothetical protein
MRARPLSERFDESVVQNVDPRRTELGYARALMLGVALMAKGAL